MPESIHANYRQQFKSRWWYKGSPIPLPTGTYLTLGGGGGLLLKLASLTYMFNKLTYVLQILIEESKLLLLLTVFEYMLPLLRSIPL